MWWHLKSSASHSSANRRKYQSSMSLVFVWGIHRWRVNSPHKWPVTRKMFPFDDIIMWNHTSQILYVISNLVYSIPMNIIEAIYSCHYSWLDHFGYREIMLYNETNNKNNKKITYNFPLHYHFIINEVLSRSKYICYLLHSKKTMVCLLSSPPGANKVSASRHYVDDINIV